MRNNTLSTIIKSGILFKKFNFSHFKGFFKYFSRENSNVNEISYLKGIFGNSFKYISSGNLIQNLFKLSK